MTNKLKVLVTGSTGKQGGAVARALIDRGHHVRALTRNPGSDAAKALAARGAAVVQGDLSDRASLRAAADGVDAVFAVSTPYEQGTKVETEQGLNIVEVAAEVGVSHLVYASVGSADRRTGIPHFDSKYIVEQRIRELGVPFTIVGPVFFMENWLSPWFLPALEQGAVALALPPGRRLAHVAVKDIGAFVALVFEHRERFVGKRIDLASDNLSGGRIAELLSRRVGRRFAFQQVPIEAMREQSEDFAEMFEWFDRVGYAVDLDRLRSDYPEVSWTSFEDWVAAQDWSGLGKKSDRTAA